MADAGDVCADDTVLEVGPGTGALTKELLSRGAHVIAIEADVRAIEALKVTFHEEISVKKLVLVHDDIRKINLGALGLRPSAFKVVANIPYYISGLLFRLFLENDIHPTTLVFLVQKEVAERIARDKKESILSLSVKVFGEPRYVKTVARGNFTPPPNVDSAIIAVSHISHEYLGGIPRNFFFTVVHEGFKSKRKQLLGNLSGLMSRVLLTHTFSTLDLKEDVRGEDVPLETWLVLTRELYIHNNPPLPPQS